MSLMFAMAASLSFSIALLCSSPAGESYQNIANSDATELPSHRPPYQPILPYFLLILLPFHRICVHLLLLVFRFCCTASEREIAFYSIFLQRTAQPIRGNCSNKSNKSWAFEQLSYAFSEAFFWSHLRWWEATPGCVITKYTSNPLHKVTQSHCMKYL